MDVVAFRQTLTAAAPPGGFSQAMQALWWDARGDWDRAHKCAMQQDDADGCAVHAYLHRKEGDMANAGGWYKRAGRDVASGTLEQEWQALVEGLPG
jgi:hypothetical protein